jgi:hypothetical protein
MSETTKEVLTRTVLQATPDGQAIKTQERVEVKVTWPKGKPEDGGRSYREYGRWVLTEEF